MKPYIYCFQSNGSELTYLQNPSCIKEGEIGGIIKEMWMVDVKISPQIGGLNIPIGCRCHIQCEDTGEGTFIRVICLLTGGLMPPNTVFGKPKEKVQFNDASFFDFVGLTHSSRGKRQEV